MKLRLSAEEALDLYEALALPLSAHDPDSTISKVRVRLRQSILDRLNPLEEKQEWTSPRELLKERDDRFNRFMTQEQRKINDLELMRQALGEGRVIEPAIKVDFVGDDEYDLRPYPKKRAPAPFMPKFNKKPGKRFT